VSICERVAFQKRHVKNSGETGYLDMKMSWFSETLNP